MASPNYITHIRFARHSTAHHGLTAPYQISSLTTLKSDQWKPPEKEIPNSYCEAICLAGFCGYEIYRHRITGYITKIILYTNTTPSFAYELNANVTDTESEDKDVQHVLAQAWNSLKKVVLPGHRYHDISMGTRATEQSQFLKENKLVKRMKLSRGNVLQTINVQTESSPLSSTSFLHGVHFEFRSHISSSVSSEPAFAYEHLKQSSGQSLVKGGPSLYYSPSNPSIYSPSRSNQQGESKQGESKQGEGDLSRDISDLNNRDIFWMGAMAFVVIFAGYLLNRCSQSKYDDD